MPRPTRIAMIGGGSYSWVPRISTDIMLTPGLENAEFRLLDIRDPETGRSRGFAILRLNQQRRIRELLVLDHHFHQPEEAVILAPLALEHAVEFGADRIFLPDDCQEWERLQFCQAVIYVGHRGDFMCW